MDFPFYVHIGNRSILWHTLVEPLAFFIGFRYLLYLKKKRGDILNSNTRFWIIIAAILGALLGSRLVGGLENPVPLSEGKNWVIHFYTNKTILGGLLGGLFAVELLKKLIGVKEASGDLFVYPIILALITGRLGCFSMGVHEETYGTATSFILGMDLGDGIQRHPVTLYEILFLVILWMYLEFLSRHHKLANGALFKLFMIGYIVFRFLLDFIKPHYIYGTGLSAIQMACITGIVWYMPYLIHPKRLLQKQNSLYA
jgi:prolipoprotein diacylglyceryltransferase